MGCTDELSYKQYAAVTMRVDCRELQARQGRVTSHPARTMLHMEQEDQSSLSVITKLVAGILEAFACHQNIAAANTADLPVEFLSKGNKGPTCPTYDGPILRAARGRWRSLLCTCPLLLA